jgi:excisionase family DNA binding protein
MNIQEKKKKSEDVGESAGPILTKQELARRWKISIKTLERITSDRVHGIRYFKIGRQVRFRLRDVEAFEQKNLTRMRMF